MFKFRGNSFYQNVYVGKCLTTILMNIIGLLIFSLTEGQKGFSYMDRVTLRVKHHKNSPYTFSGFVVDIFIF